MGGPSVPSYVAGVSLALAVPTGLDSHSLAHLPLRPQPLTAQHSHGPVSVSETQGHHKKEPRIRVSATHVCPLPVEPRLTVCVCRCVCVSVVVSVCVCLSGCVCGCECGCVCVVGERQLLEPTVGEANQPHPGVISPLKSTPVFSTISSSVFACLVKIE